MCTDRALNRFNNSRMIQDSYVLVIHRAENHQLITAVISIPLLTSLIWGRGYRIQSYIQYFGFLEKTFFSSRQKS